MFLTPSLIYCPLVETPSEPQSGHKDYFKLKTFEIQQIQIKSLPYLTKSSNFREIRLLLIPLHSRSDLRRENVNKTYPNPSSRRVLWGP